ncbi:glycoside hydrolase [Pontibacter sp. CAU 1760]
MKSTVRKFKKSLLLLLVPLSFSCGVHHQRSLQRPGNQVWMGVVIQVDPAQQYQTIDNFGASDAWSCQFVGQWPVEKRNAIADLLFSTETNADGSPKGIGLSLWRFNMGAGSAQQGAQSGIRDEWRRAESFLEADGSYNWQRQAGQVWFLKAARERGVNKFLAFPNSPPVNLTKNGKAFASNAQPNLAPERYSAYADYLTNVIQGVERTQGIHFDYISPVNEPQWDWSDGGQEGTPFGNDDIAGIVRALNASLAKRDLNTRIDVAEAGKIDYLYTQGDKPGRGNQIDAFFQQNSPHYLGDLSHIGHRISGHSYFTTSPYDQAVAKRRQLAQKVASVPGLKFWQSEYCILGDNAGEINGNKRDLGIDPALYLARVVHNDLTVANATAWQWWLAVSPYDYKDGLVYIDRDKADGAYYESKMLWALGNYSRFIRPGAIRVSTHIAGEQLEDNSLLASSYIYAAKNQLIMVVVNAGTAPVKFRMSTKGVRIASMRTYTTSADDNLKPGALVMGSSEVKLLPRSVTTLVASLR